MKWMIDPDDDDYVCETHGDQVIVASVVDCGSKDDRRRHAHLIAAAPEMLEALEAVALRNNPGDGPCFCTVNVYAHGTEHHLSCQRARAAIKKARGEL